MRLFQSVVDSFWDQKLCMNATLRRLNGEGWGGDNSIQPCILSLRSQGLCHPTNSGRSFLVDWLLQFGKHICIRNAAHLNKFLSHKEAHSVQRGSKSLQYLALSVPDSFPLSQICSVVNFFQNSHSRCLLSRRLFWCAHCLQFVHEPRTNCP